MEIVEITRVTYAAVQFTRLSGGTASNFNALGVF